MKDWLRDLYDGFTPEWFFRVSGVLVGIFIVTTGFWPGAPKDGYADDLWPNVVWLYVAWGWRN